MEKKKKIIGLIVSISVILLITSFSVYPYSAVYTTVPTAPVLNPVPSPNIDGSVELSWSKPAGAQYFEVFRWGFIGWFYLESHHYSTTYTDNNVGDGKTYKYKVVAVNPLGKSSDSNIVEVDIRLRILILPSVPVLDSITSPDADGSISLSWSLSQNADDYEVFRSVNDGTYSLFKTLTLTSTSFTESDGSYSYKVRATNSDGYSAYSNVVSVIVDILILPSIPILNLNELLLDDDLIGLDWAFSQNAVGYEVHRSVNGGIYSLFKILTWNSVWFDATYGSYSYKVRAYNDDGYSNYSNVVSITIDYPLLPSVPALNPIPSPDIDGLISLSWSPSQNVVNYKVYRSISDGLYVLFKTSVITSVSFTESDGSYSYKVRAYNDVGYSDYSNIVSVIVDIPVSLPTPYLNVISPSTDTDGTIDLIWAILIGIDSYEVYRNKDGGLFSLITTTSSTSYRDSGLTNGVYRYKIIAKYIDGDSPYSNTVSVIVSIYVPPVPPVPPPVPPTVNIELIALGIGLLSIGGIVIFLFLKKRQKHR